MIWRMNCLLHINKIFMIYPQEIVTNKSEVLRDNFLQNVTPALSFPYVKYVVTQ